MMMKLLLVFVLIVLIPTTASAELLFDGTFQNDDHFDTGTFGAFGASRVDSNITVMSAKSLGREGYTTKWHMTADGEYTVYQNPIEPDNPVQYQLLFTDGTPLYIKTGQEIWYGWSIYLDSSWKPSESWEAVGMSLDAWNVGGYGLQFSPGTTDTYFIMNGGTPSTPTFTMQTGKWYDIVYHIKWSYDSSGFVEVYMTEPPQTTNYSIIYALSNIQTRLQNEHENIDMTFGISRSARNTKNQIVYFMDPKIGTRMEDVVFDSSRRDQARPPTKPIEPVILSSIFDILGDRYITDISELPYNSGVPDMQWQTSGSINAWIDVVGFRNLSKEDNKYFIFGDPANLAIIQSGIRASVCDECTVTSFTKTQTVSISNNNIIASLHVVLEYYITTTSCSSSSSSTPSSASEADEEGEDEDEEEETCTTSTSYYSESATFTDTEIIPDQYDKTIPDLKINVTEYNNTINPRTVLDLPTKNLTYINYVYNDEYIQNYRKTARVEQTEKGIYFANLTTVNFWTAGTPLLHQMNNQVMIQKTASPDYPALKVTVSNLYETKQITDYAIVRDTYNIERTFNSLFYLILFMSSTMISMIVFILKGKRIVGRI